MQISFNLWLKWNIPTEISSFAVTDIEGNCAAAAVRAFDFHYLWYL